MSGPSRFPQPRRSLGVFDKLITSYLRLSAVLPTWRVGATGDQLSP